MWGIAKMAVSHCFSLRNVILQFLSSKGSLFALFYLGWLSILLRLPTEGSERDFVTWASNRSTPFTCSLASCNCPQNKAAEEVRCGRD